LVLSPPLQNDPPPSLPGWLNVRIAPSPPKASVGVLTMEFPEKTVSSLKRGSMALFNAFFSLFFQIARCEDTCPVQTSRRPFLSRVQDIVFSFFPLPSISRRFFFLPGDSAFFFLLFSNPQKDIYVETIHNSPPPPSSGSEAFGFLPRAVTDFSTVWTFSRAVLVKFGGFPRLRSLSFFPRHALPFHFVP